MRVETLALLASLYFSLVCNGLFWSASLAGRSLAEPNTWLLIASLFVAITAIHFVILGLVLNRWTAKPLLGLLLVITAFAAYYMSTFTVFLDPGMLRNIVRTDVKEAGELFNFGMLPPLLLLAALPLVVLWRIRLRVDGLRRACSAPTPTRPSGRACRSGSTPRSGKAGSSAANPRCSSSSSAKRRAPPTRGSRVTRGRQRPNWRSSTSSTSAR
ncbi:MAG: DUF1705 domain-containing protein [Propionivibrio sp.]